MIWAYILTFLWFWCVMGAAYAVDFGLFALRKPEIIADLSRKHLPHPVSPLVIAGVIFLLMWPYCLYIDILNIRDWIRRHG